MYLTFSFNVQHVTINILCIYSKKELIVFKKLNKF